MTRPVSADDRPLDPDTISGASRVAENYHRAANLAIDEVRENESLAPDVAAIARTSVAHATSNLAIAAELRALRLTIVAEGRANRSGR